MNAKPKVIRLTFSALSNWLKKGVVQMGIADCVTLPVQCSGSDQSAMDKDGEVYVEIPAKYASLLEASSSVAVLADEIRAVSTASQTTSDELKYRLANLREAWVPIVFRAEWFVRVERPGTSSPVASQHEPKVVLHTESIAQVDNQPHVELSTASDHGEPAAPASGNTVSGELTAPVQHEPVRTKTKPQTARKPAKPKVAKSDKEPMF